MSLPYKLRFVFAIRKRVTPLLSSGWLMMGNEEYPGAGNFSEVESNLRVAWRSTTKQCGIFKLLQAYLRM